MTTLIYLWRVRLSVRTSDFHSKDQGFESPTRYQDKINVLRDGISKEHFNLKERGETQEAPWYCLQV